MCTGVRLAKVGIAEGLAASMPDHIGILVKGRNIACVSFAALPHDGRCYTLVGGCPVSDVPFTQCHSGAPR